MAYIMVMGLEIHAELLTKSKLFCTCTAEFGGDPNTRACPVCAGMPGALPVLNRQAVENTVRFGYALNCGINRFSRWDRKNYFYPDLPSAYQISQLDLPLCIAGKVNVEAEDGSWSKDIRINRIHLEADAGKLVHDDFNAVSLADYNRSSIGLMEIVTEPDFRSAEEVRIFVEKVNQLLRYSGVCDGKMEQGSMRVDVNLSVMKDTDTEFGTRTEMKNLNSVKSIVRAIDFEAKRQIALLESGKPVKQETRRFNENRGDTKALRSKEDAHDYRYFPDPDIPPVRFTEDDLARIRAELPELPDSRLARYTGEFGLSKTDAQILLAQVSTSDFFDAAVRAYNNPRSVASFVLVELLRRVNLGEATMEGLPFTADAFADLVRMADEEKVSKNDAKTLLRFMIETGKAPEALAKEHGFLIVNDLSAVEAKIDEILAANAAAVEQYRAGEQKVFGFLMGLCTKELRGVSTPKAIKEALEAKLAASGN